MGLWAYAGNDKPAIDHPYQKMIPENLKNDVIQSNINFQIKLEEHKAEKLVRKVQNFYEERFAEVA
jgi:hypothetical protein